MRKRALPSRLIRASAGTGKTFQLSNRYLLLLACGESPDRILATTFTKKAAKEIEERIFSRLASAACSEEAATKLGHEIEAEGFDQRRALDTLSRLVSNQHRLHIRTMDSFFAAIATCFALELGFPGVIKILENSETEEILLEAAEAVCADGTTRELIRQLGGGKLSRNVSRTLTDGIGDLRTLLLDSRAESWSRLPDPGPAPSGELKALLAELEQLPVPLTKSGTPNKSYTSLGILTARRILSRDWSEFFTKGAGKNLLAGNTTYSRRPLPPDWIRFFERAIDAGRRDSLSGIARQTRATHALVTLLNREIERILQQRAWLGFSDIKHRLAARAFTEEFSDVCFRIDSEIHHLLLDEAQDTSRAEWAVLSPIVEEVLSKSGEDYSFFCVGDVKQAIYHWRGGTSAIFDFLEKRVKSKPNETSQRCSQTVIDCVNTVFGKIDQSSALGKYGAAGRIWRKIFSPHTGTARPGLVRIESGTVDIAERTAEICAEILSQTPDAEIGILVRQNNALPRILHALSKRELRASGEGASSVLDSRGACALISLCRLVDHPADGVSKFHVASSPLGPIVGFTDHRDDARAQSTAHRLRESFIRRGFGETLAEIIRPLAPDARLDQLVELGFRFDAERRLRMRGFIEYVGQTKVEDIAGLNIRVMTIHRSKGLEFDAVILPELDRPFLRRGGCPPVFALHENPLEPATYVLRAPPTGVRAALPALDELAKAYEHEAVHEQLSLLYVALTRARRALYLPFARGAIGTPAGIISEAFSLQEGETREYGDSKWHFTLSRKAGEPVQPPVSVTLGKPLRPRTLERKTPSVTRRPVRRAMFLRGRILHRLFELTAWIDKPLDRAKLEHEILRMGGETDAYMREFLSALEHPAIRALFTEANYPGARLYREHPFVIRERNALLRGSFDRIVVDDRGVEIIDFKSERIDKDTDLLERVESYRPQLEAYERAARKIFRGKSVWSKLAFFSMGRVINVSGEGGV